MKLISVSANVFINPEYVSCIEQRNIEGTSVTYVWLGEKSYVLTVPFENFYKEFIDYNNDDSGGEIKQYWAG